MKFSILAFLLLFSSLNDCSDQEITSVESFIYESSTRGSSSVYTVTSNMIEIKSTGINPSENSEKITSEEWNNLMTIFSKIDVSKIEDLKAPSDSRATDAALIANLSIRKKDTIYETNSFDHGNPPEMLKPLVQAILRLAENVE